MSGSCEFTPGELGLVVATSADDVTAAVNKHG